MAPALRVQVNKGKGNRYSLVDDTLNAIATQLQSIHFGTVGEAHKVVARRVEQVTTAGRIQIKEDTRHNNDPLLQTGLEEVETVRDRAGQPLEVQPQVKGRVGHVLDDKAHGAQALDNVVTLVAEVVLQSLHLGLDQSGIQHGNGSLLEGGVGATIKVRSTRANGLDELLGADNPSNTPARQAETLGQTVNDENIILINVDDVLGGTDGSAITVTGVVVAGVELVADESGAFTADVLDLS